MISHPHLSQRCITALADCDKNEIHVRRLLFLHFFSHEVKLPWVSQNEIHVRRLLFLHFFSHEVKLPWVSQNEKVSILSIVLSIVVDYGRDFPLV
jgi:hypothetical protein